MGADVGDRETDMVSIESCERPAMCGVMTTLSRRAERLRQMWLALDDVEAGAGDGAVAEGGDQGLGVDEAAAADVDEEAGRPERAQDLRVDDVMAFGAAERRDDEEVGPLGERFDAVGI